MKLKYKFKSLQTSDADLFVKKIEGREIRLLSNDGVVASIYMDPRYKAVLTTEQVTKVF